MVIVIIIQDLYTTQITQGTEKIKENFGSDEINYFL